MDHPTERKDKRQDRQAPLPGKIFYDLRDLITPPRALKKDSPGSLQVDDSATISDAPKTLVLLSKKAKQEAIDAQQPAAITEATSTTNTLLIPSSMSDMSKIGMTVAN